VIFIFRKKKEKKEEFLIKFYYFQKNLNNLNEKEKKFLEQE
jgi:hypothetical protein